MSRVTSDRSESTTSSLSEEQVFSLTSSESSSEISSEISSEVSSELSSGEVSIPVSVTRSRSRSGEASDAEISVTVKRQVTTREMPQVFITGQQIIDSKKISFFGNDVEDSAETKDVKLKITMLQSFLTNPMPPFGRDADDEKQYSKEIESVKLAVPMLYNRLVSSIDIWLKKKWRLSDYSSERFDMLKKLKASVLKEESMFAQAVTDYRARNLGKSLPEGVKQLTWMDMLLFERSEKIDLDDPSISFEMTGGATSNVFKIKKDGKFWYFKEEESTLTGNILEISQVTAKKVPSLPPKLLSSFQTALKKDWTDRGGETHETRKLLRDFFERFKSESDPWNFPKDKKRNSRIETFLETVPKNKRKVFSEYYSYFYKAVLQQNISVHGAGIEAGSNLSRRNVATSRLASLLGIGDMMAESRTAVIKTGGRTLVGNLMEDAHGKTVYALKAQVASDRSLRRLIYSEEAEDQVIMLQVFDFLCGQVDRHHGNFLLQTERSAKGDLVITGLKGIDNDMAFGRMSFDRANCGVVKLLPPDDLTLQSIPPKFKDMILGMDESFLKLMLMDLLSSDELYALGDRLKGLKARIRRSEKNLERELLLSPHADRATERDYRFRKLRFLSQLNPDFGHRARRSCFDRSITATDREIHIRFLQRRAAQAKKQPHKQTGGSTKQ